jgi:hypothetical protein
MEKNSENGHKVNMHGWITRVLLVSFFVVFAVGGINHLSDSNPLPLPLLPTFDISSNALNPSLSFSCSFFLFQVHAQYN